MHRATLLSSCQKKNLLRELSERSEVDPLELLNSFIRCVSKSDQEGAKSFFLRACRSFPLNQEGFLEVRDQARFLPLAETVFKEMRFFEPELFLSSSLLKELFLFGFYADDSLQLLDCAKEFIFALFSSEKQVSLQLFDQVSEALQEIDQVMRQEGNCHFCCRIKESLLPFKEALLPLERSCYKKKLLQEFASNSIEGLDRFSCEGVVFEQIVQDPYMLANHYFIPSFSVDEGEWKKMRDELLSLVFEDTSTDLYRVLDEMEDDIDSQEIREFQRRKAVYVFSFLEGDESKKSFASRLSDGVNRCADGIHLLLDELATRYVAKASSSLGGKVSSVLQQIKQEFINKHGDARVLCKSFENVPIAPELYYVESNTYLPLFVSDCMQRACFLLGEKKSLEQQEFTPLYFERSGFGVFSENYTLEALLERFFLGGEIVLSDRYFTHREAFSPFTKERFIRAIYDNFQKPSGDVEKVLCRQDLIDFMRTYYDRELHSEYEALLEGVDVDRKYFNEALDLTEEGVSRLLTLLGYLSY